MSRGTRMGLLGAALVVVIVAIVIAVASGGDDNNDKSKQTTTGQTTTAKPQVTQIRVVNAKPVGGITKIDVKKGERVRFTVTSDTADEVHVHGYDFMKDVEKDGTISFNFPATIAGVFEIELEGRKEQIAQLKVEP
jgi:FtsP/CotA-like multicopper oxidase with cupredoxin domain